MKVVTGKREYEVLAYFAEGQDGTNLANDFCTKNKNAAVLCVQDGFIYLADKNDKGTPVKDWRKTINER